MLQFRQIKLLFLAGTYIVDIQSPFNATDQSRIRLRNISDTVTTITSFSQTITNNAFMIITINLTLSASKIFELQYYVTTTNGNTDLGLPDGIESDETYTMIRVVKI